MCHIVAPSSVWEVYFMEASRPAPTHEKAVHIFEKSCSNVVFKIFLLLCRISSSVKSTPSICTTVVQGIDMYCVCYFICFAGIPVNYGHCFDFFHLLWNLIWSALIIQFQLDVQFVLTGTNKFKEKVWVAMECKIEWAVTWWPQGHKSLKMLAGDQRTAVSWPAYGWGYCQRCESGLNKTQNLRCFGQPALQFHLAEAILN